VEITEQHGNLSAASTGLSATMSIVGSMLFTNGIVGTDPVTGLTPDDIDVQVTNCFSNLAGMLAGAGARLADVGMVTVLVRDDAVRARVNRVWLQHFPDEITRPARNTVLRQDLRCSIQLDAIAILNHS
jgi:2-iminobutanoate/2-iminopropanoate deaminase